MEVNHESTCATFRALPSAKQLVVLALAEALATSCSSREEIIAEAEMMEQEGIPAKAAKAAQEVALVAFEAEIVSRLVGGIR